MKTSTLAFIFALILLSPFGQNVYCQEKMATSLVAPPYGLSTLDDTILKEVSRYLGVRYKRGGSSSSGVDCSGFIRLIYRNIFHVDLPYIASYQSRLPFFENISLEELRTGDLVYFSPTTNKKRINHVGIYLSDGNFAHAIEAKGVTISSLHNRHWRLRIKTIKRIKTRNYS